MLRQHTFYEGGERIGVELYGMHADDVPTWIDRNERRPRLHRVRAPYTKLPIIHRGVRGLQSQRGIPNVVGDALLGVFAAVHTDDRDPRSVSFLELPQLRKNMDAVDSAVGPEIEKEQFAAEVGERQTTSTGVHPIERIWKIGGAN